MRFLLPTQPALVGVGRGTEAQWGAEILRQPLLEPEGGLVVEVTLLLSDPHEVRKLIRWQPLHPDQQAALVTTTAVPLLDQVVNRLE